MSVESISSLFGVHKGTTKTLLITIMLAVNEASIVDQGNSRLFLIAFEQIHKLNIKCGESPVLEKT